MFSVLQDGSQEWILSYFYQYWLQVCLYPESLQQFNISLSKLNYIPILNKSYSIRAHCLEEWEEPMLISKISKRLMQAWYQVSCSSKSICLMLTSFGEIKRQRKYSSSIDMDCGMKMLSNTSCFTEIEELDRSICFLMTRKELNRFCFW